MIGTGPPAEKDSLARLAAFAKRIIAVPKKEIDAKERKYKARRAQKKSLA